MTASGMRLGKLFRARDGGRHAAGARRQFEFGAEVRQDLAPLDRHRLRHDEDEPVAARRRDECEADAGVARRRLDQHGLAGLDRPSASSASIIDDADAILDRRQRVEELELQEMSALTLAACVDLRQAHERRVADGLGDAES